MRWSTAVLSSSVLFLTSSALAAAKVLAIFFILTPLGAATASVPVVYHSPSDDGVPPGAPEEIGPGVQTTLHLYIDAGSNASTEVRCHDGTGDEICAWDLSLEGQNGLGLSSFTPNVGVVYYLSGSTVQLNGGDPWRGTLGPRKLGDLVVQGTTNGTLELLPSQSVNAAAGLDTIPQTTVITVPEPGSLLGLFSGVLLLRALAWRRRRTRDKAAALEYGRTAIILLASLGLVPQLAASPAQAQTPVCGDVVVDDVLDILDLEAIRLFLTGDPGALDLQNDPDLLARCDVSNNSQCDIQDYARIKRYMLDLPGGMDATCVHALPSSVVLPPPTVDQASPVSTDRASVVLSGTANPNDLIRVTGAYAHPSAQTNSAGTWAIEVPLVFDTLNVLDVFVDHGGGYLGTAVTVNVTQIPPAVTSTVRGIVVDAMDGTPVAGATVTVDSMMDTTDDLGRFAISGIPSGLVVVRAEHPQFVPEASFASTSGIFIGDEGATSPRAHEIGMVSRAPSVLIGSAGGIVTSAAGVELAIPAGSLPTDTQISLTDLPSPRARGFGGVPLVDIGPGAITFDPPAILTIPTSLTPASLLEGLRVEFAKIDQANAVSAPTYGLINSAGEIEIEIASTNGDGWEIDLRDEEVNYIVSGSGTEVVTVVIPNCTDEPVSHKGVGLVPAFRNPVFRANPETSDPFLAGLLTGFPETLLGKGLFVPDGYSILGGELELLEVPPGQVGIFEFDVQVYRVGQDVYSLRWPGGAGQATRDRVGDVTYEVIDILGIEAVNFLNAGASACPTPTAAGWGEPHLIRFDHVGEAISHSRGNGRYDFQASGEFILFESTEDGMVVQARMQPANASTTAITAAAMDVDGDRVTIYSQAVLDVRVEGVPTPLTVGVPVALPGGGELERGTTGRGKDMVTVRWSDGSEMLVSEWTTSISYLNLFPKLGPARFAKVQGLLGNSNGVLIDDFNLRDGTPADPATKHTTYADSWRISQAESLFDYGPGEDTSTYNGTPADPDYTVEDLDPAAVAAATASCNAAGIVDEPWLSDCIIDVVVFDDPGVVGTVDDAESQVPATGTYVAVPGQANIFGAGLSSVPDFGGGGGNGILPTEVVLPAGTGRTLRVLDAAGTISFSAGSSIPPDGLGSSPVKWGDWGGLAGPTTSRTGISMGVFLGDASRPATTPPPYPCGDATGDYVAPQVGQIFCLGDGLSAFSEPQFVLVPDDATRLFLGYADRNVPLIDFESGYSEGDSVTSISTAMNQVAVSTSGPAQVAEVGSPTRAFDPSDTPTGGTSGSFFLADRGGQATSDNRDFYTLVFSSAVSEVSLDLYDFRAESGIPIGAAATLSAYSDAGMSTLVDSDAFTIPSPNPADGNVVPLQVQSPFGILAVELTLDANDWGTGIDNISFSMDATPPGEFDDNGGTHEFVLEFFQ